MIVVKTPEVLTICGDFAHLYGGIQYCAAIQKYQRVVNNSTDFHETDIYYFDPRITALCDYHVASLASGKFVTPESLQRDFMSYSGNPEEQALIATACHGGFRSIHFPGAMVSPAIVSQESLTILEQHLLLVEAKPFFLDWRDISRTDFYTLQHLAYPTMKAVYDGDIKVFAGYLNIIWSELRKKKGWDHTQDDMLAVARGFGAWGGRFVEPGRLLLVAPPDTHEQIRAGIGAIVHKVKFSTVGSHVLVYEG